MRSQITTKMPSKIITAIDIIAARCEISRSNFLEINSTLSILNNKICPLKDTDLNEIISALITKSSCSVRKEFKELHQRLSLDVKKEIVKFFYEANLIEHIRYSCVKQANFYKGENYLFYYAILDMKNTDINVFVNDLDLPMQIIGLSNAPSSEYVFLGKRRYFTRKDQESNEFNKICNLLGVPSCEVIKIHYKDLNKLTVALKSL
ncbi:hypothetical protein [Neobacillus vireti]|uniref:hypothetical protein n=1 Tax=Neobacillus vireti TaxID=220686 RepID=UPI002FFDBB26